MIAVTNTITIISTTSCMNTDSSAGAASGVDPDYLSQHMPPSTANAGQPKQSK